MRVATKRCLDCGVRVGWVGFVVDSFLVILKLLVGIRTGSRAMMADALYSLIDVASAILVIISLRVSRRDVNEEYSYGHGKIEFVAVAGVALCVSGFALLLLHRVVDDLAIGNHQAGSPLAAATAALSACACFFIWRYAHCAGSRLNSPIVLTHAEHNKADAISSAAVLVAIVLSWVGLGFLDPMIAVLEILHILYISISLLRRGVKGLLDGSVPRETVAEIQRVARAVPGVVGVEKVRARHTGSGIWIEMTVKLSAHRRMSEAGAIRALVRSALLSRIEHVGNIMIAVQPALPVSNQLMGQPQLEGTP